MKKLFPAVVLSLSVLLTQASEPANAVTLIRTGELAVSDLTFNRPQPLVPCQLSFIGDNVYYDVYSADHAGGPMTISLRGQYSGGGSLADPFVALYAGAFNPGDPCGNFVDANNDDPNDPLTYDAFLDFADLPANRYYVVATSDSNAEVGTYTLTWTVRAPGPPPIHGAPASGPVSTILLAVLLSLCGVFWPRRRTG